MAQACLFNDASSQLLVMIQLIGWRQARQPGQPTLRQVALCLSSRYNRSAKLYLRVRPLRLLVPPRAFRCFTSNGNSKGQIYRMLRTRRYQSATWDLLMQAATPYG